MSNHLHDALFAPHEGRGTVFLCLPDGTAVTHAAFCALASRAEATATTSAPGTCRSAGR